MSTNSLIINEHVLVHAKDGGNGYLGWCEHCGVKLETDLVYCSWVGFKCIDRMPMSLNEFPDIIRSYVNFNSLIFNGKRFIKPYSEIRYTVKQLVQIVSKIKIILK